MILPLSALGLLVVEGERKIVQLHMLKEQPIRVISFTDKLCCLFNMLNHPKSRRLVD